MQQLILQSPGNRMAPLAIEPRDLLAAGEDPRLGRRGPRPVSQEPVASHAGPGQRPTEPSPLPVPADDPAQQSLTAETHHIRRRVSRPARDPARPFQLHDRHGRLGRDAADFPPEIPVQHEIADDHHPPAGKGLEHRLHSSWVHGCSIPDHARAPRTRRRMALVD
jgi:hypothetical protein